MAGIKKPMLACQNEAEEVLAKVRFPVAVSPKIDGVRARVDNATVLGRSLKEIPNVQVLKLFGAPELQGFDGEITVGDPTAEDVFRKTAGYCNRQDDSSAVPTLRVFDLWDQPCMTFDRRISEAEARAEEFGHPAVLYVPTRIILSMNTLLAYEKEQLDLGWEGLILRDPRGLYKYGRSTLREQGMMKLKRFTDGEFILRDVEEEMENTNAPKRNKLGRTERSSSKAGLVGKGRAGTLVGEDLKSGVLVRLGSGLDDADKAYFWKHRKRLKDKFVGKYKSFLVGVKRLPRHPVYLGPRPEWDF